MYITEINHQRFNSTGSSLIFDVVHLVTVIKNSANWIFWYHSSPKKNSHCLSKV